MTTPSVSIIIPNYNRCELLLETVASCLNQGIETEVIVVDDGSADGSPEAVRQRFPQVTVICQENAGAPAARNSGLDAATGEFIKFLDSDDLLAEGMLGRQIKALCKTDVDVVYGDFEMIGNLSDSRVGGKPLRITGPQDDIIGALLGDWWCAPFCYLYRREALQNIRWREDLACLQDFDFVLQVALTGARFVYVPGTDGYYRIHEGQITEGTALKYAQSRRLILDACVEQLRSRDELTPYRRQMLAHGYWTIAQATYGSDGDAFKHAHTMVQNLVGRWFLPKFWGGLPVRCMTSLLGIPATEAVRSGVRGLRRRR